MFTLCPPLCPSVRPPNLTPKRPSARSPNRPPARQPASQPASQSASQPASQSVSSSDFVSAITLNTIKGMWMKPGMWQYVDYARAFQRINGFEALYASRAVCGVRVRPYSLLMSKHMRFFPK